MATLKKYKQNIIIPEINPEIHPGDNFYKYVNDTWLNTTKIPDYESSFSVNEEIEEIIQKDLFSLIEECEILAKKGNKVHSFDAILKDTIGRFALSSNRIAVQKNSIESLKKGLLNLHCIRSIDDIGEILGFLCRNKIPTIIGSFLQLERTEHNTSVYTLFLTTGNLGLPDISYYNATAPGKLRTLIAYLQLIKSICKLLDIDDISETVTFESYFSAHIEGLSNDESFLIKGKELIKTFKGFPWETFFTTYGISSWKDKIFRIQSKKYLHVLENTFLTTPLEHFKSLFMLHLILHALPILPPPYDDLHFKFYQNRLRGQKKKVAQHYLTLFLSQTYLSKPLSILYKKMYLKDLLKIHATKFIEKIRSSALKQIETNSWMEDSTKYLAKEKIKNMVLSIGWPESYPKFVLPLLQTDNLLENVYLLSTSSTDEDISLLNKTSIPGKTWNEPSYIVNAFYYNEINEFIVPAGSLLYPFFGGDNECSIGWNYGGLGCVIGHEMIHAFDDDGKDYDQHGLYNPWWKPRDNRRFHVISKKLVEIYNNSKVYGINVNGSLTLNENLADLGGFSIALEALKHEIADKSEKERKYELQQFFISYAVSWRTREDKKKILQGLIIDRHSPAELRVNLIVSQIDEWYDIFDVKVANNLFVAPEDRAKIY